MRVFVVLTLAVVVPGLALGRLLSKCELKRELEEANLELSDGAKRKLSDEDFVAKIVCHVEKSTGFNTSTVIRMNPDGELGPPRRERRSTAGGHLGAGHLHTKMPPRTRPPDFIDDDITDDIECLETLKMRLENGLHGPHKIAFMRMAKLLFQRECYQVVSSDYFSDC